MFQILFDFCTIRSTDSSHFPDVINALPLPNTPVFTDIHGLIMRYNIIPKYAVFIISLCM